MTLLDFLQSGWVFSYDPSTRFIGAYHPNGGKQSICEIRSRFDNDNIGNDIVQLINKQKENNND
jgi:hypothetical protein